MKALNNRIEKLEKTISPEPIVWEEIRTVTMEQQRHPERFREVVLSDETTNGVRFITKELEKK